MSTDEILAKLYSFRDNRMANRWSDHLFYNLYKKDYKGGFQYCGQIKDDKRHGKGFYYFRNQEHYLGDWQDDLMHG